MLVITRQLDETLVMTVGKERIVVHVLRFSGSYGNRDVRLGIEASNEVTILRGELEQRDSGEGL